MSRPRSLAMRMMAGQIVVIAVGALTLAATAALIAPRLFTYHFDQTGEADGIVRYHAQQAFESSFALALVLGVFASIIGAGLLSWLLTRRISQPIEQLSQAAQAVAAGNYDVAVPHDTFGRELAALSDAFEDMAVQLAATEATRRRLLADLAHELRTPLATLEAHIDGLEDGIVPGTTDTYAVMRHQVTRLRRLTSDMRTLTEVEAHALDLHLQPTPVSAIIEDACSSAERRYQAKHVALECAPCGHDTVVDVDADRLQQVMANLLENALRHTTSNGTVTVACSCTAGSTLITVTDTGDGISPDQLNAVFDRFHRADTSRHNDGEGSGLGLTIARGIITDHHGTLTAESEGLGRGARFCITLPTPHHE
ncbi:MAG: Histidine kinase [Actinomycetota bacterium]|nr:Histidine kinase [Actinomycetota bacterium]